MMWDLHTSVDTATIQDKTVQLEKVVQDHGTAKNDSKLAKDVETIEDKLTVLPKTKDARKDLVLDEDIQEKTEKVRQHIIHDHKLMEDELDQTVVIEEKDIDTLADTHEHNDSHTLDRIEKVKHNVTADTEASWAIDMHNEITIHQEDIDTFVYRLHGEVHGNAKSIEVLARNDGIYGLMDHYTLQKFQPWDDNREYFIKPNFKTILPGSNYYTIKAHREDGTSTEYIHEIKLISDRFDHISIQTQEDGISNNKTDQYAGQVKLTGYIEEKRVPYCTAGRWFDIQECEKRGMIAYTHQYILHIKSVSDPRRYLFDNIQNHDEISLWCIGDPWFVRRYAGLYGSGLISNIYTADPSQLIDIDIRKEYFMNFNDDWYCGISPEISKIING